VTDQHSLTQAILCQSNNLSSRQCRYIDFIAQYSTDIIYIPGSTNVVADCLSRTECNALFETIPPISMHEIAIEQEKDANLHQFLNNSNSRFNVDMRPVTDSNHTLIGDVSYGELGSMSHIDCVESYSTFFISFPILGPEILEILFLTVLCGPE